MPIVQMRDSEGKFLPEDRLKKIFEGLGASFDKTIVTYCTGGVQACVGAFAALECGFPNVRVYNASWSEFGAIEETKDITEVFANDLLEF